MHKEIDFENDIVDVQSKLTFKLNANRSAALQGIAVAHEGWPLAWSIAARELPTFATAPLG